MRQALSSVLFSFCFISFAQSIEEIELCTALQSSQFYNENEANLALDRILDASGLAKNFTLTPCDNIKNAAAISYKGVRYILYDKEFLQTITDYTNDWANLFILAHEVGHHLNGHSVDVTMIDIVETKSLEAKRRQELEADEFAAFILAQLGAPLNALIEPIDLVVTDKDDTYSSHPNKSRRVMAIRRGYNKYKLKIITKVVGENSKIEDVQINTSQSKTVSANTKKIESNLGESDETWSLTDFSDNPFSEIVYLASIQGEALNKAINSISFEIYKYKEDQPVFKLTNLQGLLKNHLYEANLLKKLTSTNYVSEFDDYRINFKVSIAVDKDLICDGVISIEEFKGSLPVYNFLIERELEIGIGTQGLKNLIPTIKKGNQLYIKIDSYDITAKLKKDSSRFRKTVSYLMYDETNIDEELIIRFSLKGSSDALKWFQSR